MTSTRRRIFWSNFEIDLTFTTPQTIRICAPIWTPFQNFRRRSQDGLDPSKGFSPQPYWHRPKIIAKTPFCIAKRPKDPGFGPLWDHFPRSRGPYDPQVVSLGQWPCLPLGAKTTNACVCVLYVKGSRPLPREVYSDRWAPGG